jgi:hypothetical protein
VLVAHEMLMVQIRFFLLLHLLAEVLVPKELSTEARAVLAAVEEEPLHPVVQQVAAPHLHLDKVQLAAVAAVMILAPEAAVELVL